MIGEKPTEGRVRMQLLKVKAGGQVTGVFLSEDIGCLRLHWLGSRSYVCSGVGCPACVEWPSRWTGFAPVAIEVGSGQQRIHLLEFTESAWTRFDGLRRLEGHPTLFGWRASIVRLRNKSPLLIEPIDVCNLERAPVKGTVIYSALATLYGLPSIGPDETMDLWQERASRLAAHQLEGDV